MNRLRYTTIGNTAYFVVGAVLIWLLLPASLIDLLISPTGWHAPNWQCDTLAFPLVGGLYMLLPWAIISALVAALFALPASRHRQRGTDILQLRLGTIFWNLTITSLALLAIAFLAWEIGVFVWEATHFETFSSDCGGKAELVTVTMKGPLIQVTPLAQVALAVWILHPRALALSPRAK